MAGAVLLAVVAWQFASSQQEEPVRTALVMLRSLMPELRFAEFVRATQSVNLGGVAGQKHTVEADPQDGAAASGVLSRPDERPPFAWLVGRRPGFFLDVVEPTDRMLVLNLAAATDEPQELTILLNGHELGATPLRKDNKYMSVRVPAPADVQVRGRNRVQLDFSRVQDQVLAGEVRALPIAARIQLVQILPPEEEGVTAPRGAAVPRPPPAQFTTAADEDSRYSKLILPGGTSVGFALKLPPSERIALRLSLTRLDLPLEIWASPDGEPPLLLMRAEPEGSGPGTLAVDLSAWAGRYLGLDARVAAGPGRVELRGLMLLVPEGEGIEVAEVGEQPFQGVVEVLRDGPSPRLSWTEDGLCLVVDLASRRRQLFDLEQDKERARDISFTRPAAAAYLAQELRRAVHAGDSRPEWSSALRLLSIR